MEELKIGLHIHTSYSDGTGSIECVSRSALIAGLDVIIITDHNLWVQDIENYLQKGRRKLLILSGEEVHDNTLSDEKNHLLIFGQDRELSPFANDPQRLIDQVKSSGGLSFLAHPIEDKLQRFGEKEFSWKDWQVRGYSGIELWNYMSEFKTRSQTVPKALLHALIPHFMAVAPLNEALRLWDNLLLSQTNPVIAIGGVDAHGLQKHLGPIRITLYPYEFLFKTVTTHLLTNNKLTGSINEDKRMVYGALTQGHAFIAYDLISPASGFRFSVYNKEGQFWMGDRVQANGGLTFQIRLPRKAHARLLKDGQVIKEHFDREVLTHITSEPGIYRSEVYLNYLGKERGWIFSNPIYAI